MEAATIRGWPPPSWKEVMGSPGIDFSEDPEDLGLRTDGHLRESPAASGDVELQAHARAEP